MGMRAILVVVLVLAWAAGGLAGDLRGKHSPVDRVEAVKARAAKVGALRNQGRLIEAITSLRESLHEVESAILPEFPPPGPDQSLEVQRNRGMAEALRLDLLGGLASLHLLRAEVAEARDALARQLAMCEARPELFAGAPTAYAAARMAYLEARDGRVDRAGDLRILAMSELEAAELEPRDASAWPWLRAAAAAMVLSDPDAEPEALEDAGRSLQAAYETFPDPLALLLVDMAAVAERMGEPEQGEMLRASADQELAKVGAERIPRQAPVVRASRSPAAGAGARPLVVSSEAEIPCDGELVLTSPEHRIRVRLEGGRVTGTWASEVGKSDHRDELVREEHPGFVVKLKYKGGRLIGVTSEATHEARCRDDGPGDAVPAPCEGVLVRQGELFDITLRMQGGKVAEASAAARPDRPHPAPEVYWEELPAFRVKIRVGENGVDGVWAFPRRTGDCVPGGAAGSSGEELGSGARSPASTASRVPAPGVPDGSDSEAVPPAGGLSPVDPPGGDPAREAPGETGPGGRRTALPGGEGAAEEGLALAALAPASQPDGELLPEPPVRRGRAPRPGAADHRDLLLHLGGILVLGAVVALAPRA